MPLFDEKLKARLLDCCDTMVTAKKGQTLICCLISRLMVMFYRAFSTRLCVVNYPVVNMIIIHIIIFIAFFKKGVILWTTQKTGGECTKGKFLEGQLLLAHYIIECD